MKRSVLSLAFLMMLLLIPVLACALTEGDFTYVLTADGASITGWSSEGDTLTVPETLGGAAVTTIGERAFAGATVDSISLPRSVRSIAASAFEGSSVREVRFSYGLLSIGEHAFAECLKLVGLALPETVVSLGAGAFANCESLLYVTLPESVQSIGESAFDGCVRLRSLPMPANHPTFALEDDCLVRRADGSAVATLVPEQEETK